MDTDKLNIAKKHEVLFSIGKGELKMTNKDWTAGEMAREEPAGLALSPKRSADDSCVQFQDIDVRYPEEICRR